MPTERISTRQNACRNSMRRTPNWARRCSATSLLAVNLNLTRSPCRCYGRPPGTDSDARPSLGSRSGSRLARRSRRPFPKCLSTGRLPEPSRGTPLQRRLDSGRRDVDRLRGDGVDDLFLLFDRFLVVIGVAQNSKLTGAAAVRLKDDARQDLFALLEPKPLDVEMGHPDPPRVVGRVLAVMGVDALRHSLEEVGDFVLGRRHQWRSSNSILYPSGSRTKHRREPHSLTIYGGRSGSIPSSKSRWRVPSRSVVVIAMWP